MIIRAAGTIVSDASETAPAFHSTAPNVPAALIGIDNSCPVQSPLLNLAWYIRPLVINEFELAATAEAEPVRATIVVKALVKALANIVGSAALKKAPRLLTAACQRSSILAGMLAVPEGSGHVSTPDGKCVRLPLTPNPTVKVTICCQNAGSAALVGTLLSISVRKSFFQ